MGGLPRKRTGDAENSLVKIANSLSAPMAEIETKTTPAAGAKDEKQVLACAEGLNGMRSEAAELLARNNVKEEGRARDEAALHDQDDAEGFFEPGRAAAFGNALSANFRLET